MASTSVWIETLKRGTFRAKWREEVIGEDGLAVLGEDGKPRIKKVPGPVFHSLKKAEEWAELKRAKLAAQRAAPDTGHIPLLELIERWSASKVSSGKSNEDNMEARAIAVRSVVDALGWKVPPDCNVADVLQLIKDRKGEGSRARAYLRAMLAWSIRKLGQIVDQAVLEELAAAPSDETDYPTMSPMQYQAILARANELKQLPLVVCLGTFGWRPITAARLLVKHVNVDKREILIGVKRQRNKPRPLIHPVPEWTLDLLLPLMRGRDPDEHLFLRPTGLPWGHKNSCDNLTRWYFNHLRRFAPLSGSAYALKRYAITAMNEGAAPWTEALTSDKIMAYTGHLTLSQVQKYIRPHMERVRNAMGERVPAAVTVALKRHEVDGGKMGAEADLG